MSRISAGEMKTLLVAHKDRLCRFGCGSFRRFCSVLGLQLMPMERKTIKQDCLIESVRRSGVGRECPAYPFAA